VNSFITSPGQVTETPVLCDYVDSKLGRLQDHFDQITNTHVTLIVKKKIQKKETILHVSGAVLFPISEPEDMYATIAELADKLDRQLIKHIQKSRGH